MLHERLRVLGIFLILEQKPVVWVVCFRVIKSNKDSVACHHDQVVELWKGVFWFLEPAGAVVGGHAKAATSVRRVELPHLCTCVMLQATREKHAHLHEQEQGHKGRDSGEELAVGDVHRALWGVLEQFGLSSCSEYGWQVGCAIGRDALEALHDVFDGHAVVVNRTVGACSALYDA